MSNDWLALLSIPAAVLPTAVYVLLVWWIDRYEKEPWRLLLAAFLWGAIPAVIGAAAIEIAFDAPLIALIPRYSDFVGTSFLGPIVEELFKALAVLALLLLARYEFDGVLDGVIYGSLIGFGFAMTENLLYFLGGVEGGAGAWLTLVLGRSIVFGLNHAMFTAFAGVGLSLAAQTTGLTKRGGWALLGLGAAVTAHVLHNAFLSLGNLCLLSFLFDWIGVALILGIVILAWRREKGWLQTYLSQEVKAGLLTAEQFHVISSWRQRVMHQLRGLATDRSRRQVWRRFIHNSTELAFKRRQYARTADPQLEGRIQELRRRIQEEGAML